MGVSYKFTVKLTILGCRNRLFKEFDMTDQNCTSKTALNWGLYSTSSVNIQNSTVVGTRISCLQSSDVCVES